MKVTCKYCKKSKRVAPSHLISPPEDYHCKKCHGIWMKENQNPIPKTTPAPASVKPHGKIPWVQSEEVYLKKAVRNPFITIDEISAHLNRTEKSIRGKATLMGIYSLPRAFRKIIVERESEF